MLRFTTLNPETAKLRDRLNKMLDYTYEIESLNESEWLPDIDILEDRDNIIVKADIPGINPKQINLTITGNVLCINGERKREIGREDENYHFIGRNYGKFNRALSLPTPIDTDCIKASYENGVLTIRLPKLEKNKIGELKIQVD